MIIFGSGSIFAVCINPQEGLAKIRQHSIRLTEWGCEDDFHCKPERRSFRKPGTTKRNVDRQVTIVAYEAVRKACQAVRIPALRAGQLGENILTYGLGDLSDITPGALVRVGNSTVLKVIEQNVPCSKLSVYHPHLPKAFFGKRGLLCAVEPEGIGKIIRAGNAIEFFLP